MRNFLFGREQILSYLVVEYSVTMLNFWLLLNWKLTPDPIPIGKKMNLWDYSYWIQLSGSSKNSSGATKWIYSNPNIAVRGSKVTILQLNFIHAPIDQTFNFKKFK